MKTGPLLAGHSRSRGRQLCLKPPAAFTPSEKYT